MESDDWSWAHESNDHKAEVLDTSGVVAVLVCRNGEPWLARMLVSLGRLEQRPGRVLAVDAASTDATGDLLAKAEGEGLIDQVITLDQAQGFGRSVSEALTHLDAPLEWLWLLHDDVIIRQYALSELVAAGCQPESDGAEVGVVVPKLLLPKLRNYPDRIAEIGQTLTWSGRRVPNPGQDVEVGDLDQRQIERTRVLGGSTAGMLVRWQAWQELSGLDPAVELFYDGVDLGWRANDAGWAVVTAPNAALEHQQAGRWGERDGLEPATLDRKLAARTVASHAPSPRRASARLRVGSMFGALGYLLGKDVDRSRGQWHAFRTGREDAALALEMHERHGAPGEHGLVPSRGESFRLGIERTADALTDRVRDAEADDVSIDDLTGDDFAGKGHARRLYSPTTLVALVLIVLTLISARHLGGFAPLVGPDLPPAPRSLGDAWAAWWRPTAGVPGASAPWLFVMALGSTLTFGQPEIFVTLLIVTAPVLAMLTALRFARHIAADPLALAAAGAWGAMVPLLGVTGRGSIGLSVFAILLPAWAMSAYRCLTHRPEGPDRWRSPGMLALVTGVMAAFWPPMALGAITVAIILFARGDRWPAIVAGVAPLAVIGGWAPFLVRNPGRLLTASDSTYAPADSWRAPFGLPTFVPNWLVIATLSLMVLAGVVAVIVGNRRASLLLASGALGSAAAAALLARVVVTVDGVAVRPEPTIWLLLGIGFLLCLVLSGDMTGKGRAVVAWLLVVCAVSGAIWWVTGALTPLHRSRGPLPHYVQSAMESPRSTRVLLVDLGEGGARYSIHGSTLPQWGSGESNPLGWQPLGDTARDAARQIAEQSVADDLGDRLADVGIGYVWVSGGADSSLESAGLVAAPVNEHETVWAVPGLPAEASLRDAGDEALEPVVESTVRVQAGQTLVLAQPADSRWRATLNQQTLKPAHDRAEFSIPPGEGELSWRLAAPWWWSILQVVALALSLVFAAPSSKASAPVARRAL